MTPTERFREFRAACWTDLKRAARLLAEDPSLIDARSGLGETLLHWSAVEANVDVVRFLLEHGADPDPRNEFGNSALQECAWLCAADEQFFPAAEVLLAAGADAYHWSETVMCAWHQAQASPGTRLCSLLASLPAPTGAHETCELSALLDSPNPFGDESPDDLGEQ